MKSQQFVPYLSGLSAEGVAFSNDGQWLAYASVPEENLWKRKVDGSERLQLTFPPLQAYEPRWSPDGKKIAFQGITPGQPWKMYLISADGGEPEEVMPGIGDLGWSPDGTSLIFHSGMTDFLSTSPRSIRLLGFETRQVSTIPGSEGLYSPRWSPDGRYIAALRVGAEILLIFDVHAKKWTELTKIPSIFLSGRGTRSTSTLTRQKTLRIYIAFGLPIRSWSKWRASEACGWHQSWAVF